MPGPRRRVRRRAVSGYDAGRRWLLGPAVAVPARTWNTREPSGTPTRRNGDRRRWAASSAGESTCLTRKRSLASSPVSPTIRDLMSTPTRRSARGNTLRQVGTDSSLTAAPAPLVGRRSGSPGWAVRRQRCRADQRMAAYLPRAVDAKPAVLAAVLGLVVVDTIEVSRLGRRNLPASVVMKPPSSSPPPPIQKHDSCPPSASSPPIKRHWGRSGEKQLANVRQAIRRRRARPSGRWFANAHPEA